MNLMTLKEIEEYENGILQLQYDKFNRIINRVLTEKSSEKNITLSIMNSFTLNAHAIKKTQEEYEIIIRSGCIPMIFQVVGENVDYFKKHFSHLDSIEDAVSWACVCVWMQIFSHELGHTVRGHNDIERTQSMFNLVEELDHSPEYYAGKYSGDIDMLRMLMEFDADIYSSVYVGEQIRDLIINIKDVAPQVSERDIIKLAISGIFFFFNYVAEKERVSGKYPPSVVRINMIKSGINIAVNELISLTEEDINEATSEAVNDCIAFLIEDCYLNMDGGDMYWEHAKLVETTLKKEYSTFVELITPWE
ncbi:hypothetical protein [Vibrio anguillarum]|uniref:Uncharacterized protein n=1 Tax=Vibrio anguillarum TaxID=55601 RepID=A0ABD4QZC3_VIBAN|nr:hypothetical protein [Vibrio anguillarum]EIE9610407.1 hypothetical protein [Vibrio cholerae]ASG01743.1 hypothetical protein CEG15_16555 [Vibrio anguillarum]ASG05441.1 hypothetical protein CEJ46_16665 [Vibrio anguillarum]MBT2920602.1 hypothetical protein [Vibrio anguillarum]MBT2949653.1 hypothetical protein [Vibrio anguillarum]